MMASCGLLIGTIIQPLADPICWVRSRNGKPLPSAKFKWLGSGSMMHAI